MNRFREIILVLVTLIICGCSGSPAVITPSSPAPMPTERGTFVKSPPLSK